MRCWNQRFAVHFAGIEYPADAGMIQAGLGPRLAQQTFLLSRPVVAEHLDRHLALQLRVPGAVNPTHAALAQEAHDLETADAPASAAGRDFG